MAELAVSEVNSDTLLIVDEIALVVSPAVKTCRDFIRCLKLHVVAEAGRVRTYLCAFISF